MTETYVVKAVISITVDSMTQGALQDVARNRKQDMEEWLKRHKEDIKDSVCSWMDEIEISVGLERSDDE